MTAGFSYTNGLESLVCTDKKLTMGNRESNTSNKLEKIRSDDYHGVIYTAGSKSLADSIIKRKKEFIKDKKTVEDFVEKVHKELKTVFENHTTAWLNSELEEVDKKANLFYEGKAKERYKIKEKEKLMTKYDESKKENQTFFVVEVYDKNTDRIRRFSIGLSGHLESFSPNYPQLGSGFDGVDFYFHKKTPGIDPSKLNKEGLLYHVLNAYSYAEVDVGVGGTPKIARIDKSDVKLLHRKDVSTLTNLAGAYQAEFISSRQFKIFLSQVLKGKANYGEIAKKLNETEFNLTSATIPPSVWQERANHR